MVTFNLFNHKNLKILFLCTIVFIGSLLIGILSGLFSPLWVLAGIAALAFFFVLIKRPEIALLGILIATSSIIFEDQLPLLSIGIGSLHISDILLLGSLGLIALRRLIEPKFRIVRTPLDWPLLAFLGLALLSTAVAINNSSLNFNLGLREYRVVSYYLTFFVVTNLLREEKQLRFLVRGIFTIATIVAAAMVAQSIIGRSLPFLPGRIETLQTQGVAYADITRILPPGQSIVLVAFITITIVLVFDRTRQINILFLLQWGLLGLAVLVSFTRSFWVQAGLAILILAWVAKGRQWRRLAGLGLVVLLLVTITLLLAFDQPDSRLARLLSASAERLATLGRGETLNEGSLLWRYIENESALPQILSHPLLGLGLGARYRPYEPRIDIMAWNWDARRYIHNAHFWIMMKAGLLAYICFLWLSATFLIRSFKRWRFISNPQLKAHVLSFALTYLGVLIGAIVNPIFLQWYWTPLIGLMMGYNEVVIRKTIRESLN